MELLGQIRDRRVCASELLENAASGGVREGGERGVEAGLRILNHVVQYSQAAVNTQGEAKRQLRCRPPSRVADGRLDFQRATEHACGVVGLRTVVIREDVVVTAIAKNRAAACSDIRRCLHPTRRLRIELAQRLQLSILRFREDLNPMAAAISVALFFGLCSFLASSASRS